MRKLIGTLGVAALVVTAWVPAVCQTADAAARQLAAQIAPTQIASANTTETPLAIAPAPSAAVQALLAFKDSDVKFSMAELMDIMRDKRHEGWVLAAYPDPKTTRPLIGAGFSLDLPAREHPQTDPLNPNLFLEPSSAELWQAAGLDEAQLSTILDQFQARLAQWRARRFRRNIRRLPPQITEEDANKLLRIAIVQSVLNAHAYCRKFDALTASQQMALSQLVYQMGVNLGQFSQFLALMNGETMQQATPDEAAAQGSTPVVRDVSMQSFAQGDAGNSREVTMQSVAQGDAAYWRSVQKSLMQSQWARLYRARAVAVIAMFDPSYAESPTAAERRVSAVLRPVRRGHARRAGTKLAASHSSRSRSAHGKSKRASTTREPEA